MNLTHLCHFFPHCNNSSANTRVRSKLENRDRLKSMSTATFVGKDRHIAKKTEGSKYGHGTRTSAISLFVSILNDFSYRKKKKA